MKYRQASITVLSLLAACTCAADTATTLTETQSANWAQLQKLLQSCTGVTTNPLQAVETHMLSDAPLLGNGEVGVMAEHDANRLSFYVGRADFRRYALGGIDLVVEAPKAGGGLTPSSRHEQDIERAEIRSKVVLAGRTVEATTWLVPDQPLMISEIHNPSGQPLTLQVKTWARSPVNDFSEPFRLKAGHLSSYPVNQSLNDRQGKVVYGKPILENAELWRYVKVGDMWCLKNEATARYMAITGEGEVITMEKPDMTAFFRRVGRERQGMVQWAANGHYLNAPYDRDAPFIDPAKPLPVMATRTEAPYATASEPASHFFNAKYAGHVGDLTWASRSYLSEGTRSTACLVSRVLGGEVSVQDASQKVVIPAKGRITLIVAIPGEINHYKRTKSVESLRDEGSELVSALTHEKIEALKQQRLAHWRNYWLKAWVNTGDELLNKYWFGSMYLLNCSNQIGQQSPACSVSGTCRTIQPAPTASSIITTTSHSTTQPSPPIAANAPSRNWMTFSKPSLGLKTMPRALATKVPCGPAPFPNIYPVPHPAPSRNPPWRRAKTAKNYPTTNWMCRPSSQ